jgi:hypothetical protein
MVRAVVVLLGSALASCRGAPAASGQPEPGVSAARGSAVPAGARSAASVVVAAPAVSALPPAVMGPVRIVPPVTKFGSDMQDHVTSFGWSADSERFGYCSVSGGRGGEICVFAPRKGPVEKLDDWDEGTDHPDPVAARRLRARVKELDIKAKSGEWAFATDLEITWEHVAPSLLRVGARVRGHAPSFSILLDDPERSEDGGIHPDAIVVSPDGKWLGVISHTFHGEFTDRYGIGTVTTARAAAQAYNDAGYALHKKHDWAQATEFFERGAAADATFARPQYNLACAYARMGDARTESALRAALARAGTEAPEMRAKARTDPDFASVANAPWFAKVVE